MKLCPNDVFDAFFQYITGSAAWLVVCSGSPITFTDCTSMPPTGSYLAMIAVTGGDMTIADDTSGRKLTIAEKTSASIIYSSTACAVALVSNTTNASVCYITTCTPQDLVESGTVDIPTWKINIEDPT